jgi:opacity protein-like surface antigen
MRKLLAMAVAAGALSIAAPASAQVWQSINQRQAQLDQRIDAGVRDGSLTRTEAVRLRGEFNDLSRLEANYRASGGGLDPRERADLDRRFDGLSQQIRYQRNDDQERGGYGRGNGDWTNINDRQRDLNFRINQGLRDRSLSRVEASRLRFEFNNIARLEARYRANGLNGFERADLQRRFDVLSNRVMAERRDRNDRYG